MSTSTETISELRPAEAVQNDDWAPRAARQRSAEIMTSRVL